MLTWKNNCWCNCNWSSPVSLVWRVGQIASPSPLKCIYMSPVVSLCNPMLLLVVEGVHVEKSMQENRELVTILFKFLTRQNPNWLQKHIDTGLHVLGDLFRTVNQQITTIKPITISHHLKLEMWLVLWIKPLSWNRGIVIYQTVGKLTQFCSGLCCVLSNYFALIDFINNESHHHFLSRCVCWSNSAVSGGAMCQ